MRTWLAARFGLAGLVGLLVGGAACDRRDGPPQVQPFTITRGATCLVEYACAPGQRCPAPYEYDCSYTMWPSGVGVDGALPLARLGGTCYLREAGCTTAGCLTRTWACPPPPSKEPLPIVAWTLTRDGTGCTAQPTTRSQLAPAPPAFPVACIAAYPRGVTVIARDRDTGACEIPDEPCPEGARCEPAEDTPVPCPEPAGR